MRDTFYLVVNSRGVDRITKSAPGRLKHGERGIKVALLVDDALWRESVPTVELHIVSKEVFIEPATAEAIVETPVVCSPDEAVSQ